MLLGGGQNGLESLPLEFYSPETFGFLALFGLPHVALARALMLWVLLRYLRLVQGTEEPANLARSALGSGFLWLLAGLLQPLAALVTGFVLALHLGGMGLWSMWRSRRGAPFTGRRWWRLAGWVIMAGILPGLFVLYQVVRMWSDPFLQQWTAQNRLASPGIGYYLLAYGLLLPLACLGTLPPTSHSALIAVTTGCTAEKELSSLAVSRRNKGGSRFLSDCALPYPYISALEPGGS